ncbi:DinB family protein [Phototrophicus methaneseepsis]|uniref:DinB family protein n=1 Tax=Phototrophicus methaneseepsis TaxID=2710758 RepID=A0A7S8E8I2_9CHLR|nr:DinB family protein [Phototrophicus methaneseepsis]QPC82327.1 DinB family protein [Phototrophicus methaneseepsis]
MNADAFRHFYNYHFGMNRYIWNTFIMPLPQEQYVQEVAYSVGSVRNQVVHMANVDETWFRQLHNLDFINWREPSAFDDRDKLRAEWDQIEQMMRGYLADLRDDMLFTKPFPDHDEDKDLILWQVLLHVVNHGTDHRAQLLRLLNDLGVKTVPQDYVFYAYDHP